LYIYFLVFSINGYGLVFAIYTGDNRRKALFSMDTAVLAEDLKQVLSPAQESDICRTGEYLRAFAKLLTLNRLGFQGWSAGSPYAGASSGSVSLSFLP
jgi:hypothetical protein